ncbi:EspA/EspE family type VII secretion system effector [Mycolicibacterium poriferae]|uniref:EspA/EspE family type VII secretion system effector n=1 Tax=Mycolicibacterium poriferae TaxID=39694 RepID=UPI0024BADBD2|nr:EspA/EspE family type VII secretion system effector [Mycolicibacterium poriferae]
MTVGVLDAFLVTWSRARAAFGDGAPQDGSAYDQSPALLELQAEVAGGGPGQHWRGPGSDAYGHANDKQAAVLGEAARLDAQLRAEVDKSAEVVAAGRRELDGVRQWMLDAASEVPRTAEGERMLYPVVSRGSGEIVEILERAVADMHSISTRIGGIGAEYHALSGDLELGTGDGGGQAQIPLPSADKPMNTRG